MTPWVRRLIIANVVIFILQRVSPQVTMLFAFAPFLVLRQPWSVVTYMFLHGSVTHILFNMLGLYFFGPRLELRLGAKNFLVLYFAAGVGGALLSVVVGMIGYLGRGILPAQVAPILAQVLVVPIIGASAALFGVLYGYAHYWPRDRILIMFVLPLEVRTAVLLWVVASLWFGISGAMGGIAHFAHLGGFIGGWLYFRWIDLRSPARKFKKRVNQQAQRTAGSDAADLRRWQRIDRDAMHPVNREELDRVFQKIKTSGIGSLTLEERAFLERFTPT